jgi:hypothetical protein
VIRLHYRADGIERWIRAAAGQAQRAWFDDRWEDYEGAVLELWRLAEASGRHEIKVGIMYPPYTAGPRRKEREK